MDREPGRRSFAAIDLGATSGRIMLDDGSGTLREIHRFPTPLLRRKEAIYWDFGKLFSGVLTGLGKLPVRPAAVSCDSWAQDFGMLDERGGSIADPISYRDKGSAIYTGDRLRYIEEKFPERFARARRILHIADLVHFRLCGAARSSYPLAAFGRMPLDHPLLSPLADGEVIGSVDHPALPGLSGVPVISGAGHDTAAAVVGSGIRRGEVLISLGTWLMAAEMIEEGAVVPEKFSLLPLPGRRAARTRGGMGLWPFQQCVKIWKERGDFPGYAALDAAAEAVGGDDLIDPDAPELFSPENMEEAVCALAGKPLTPPEITARLIRGAARRTAETVGAFGTDFRRAVLVGGAAGSGFIRRLVASALPCPMSVGSTEAAAAGNIAVQRAVWEKSFGKEEQEAR